MPLSQMIAPHLPYIRRFARALSGGQDSGDAYVRAFLEILVEDPAALPADEDSRIAVYRVFLRLWNTIDLNLETNHGGAEMTDAVDRKLENITPLPRQAFLLRWVEGFSAEETARILATTLADVERLIDEAGREIAGQVATNVLIIEDEPMIAMNLGEIVESLGHSVTAIARTHDEAVRAADIRPPGLVLADIQLADGSSGVDAVNKLLESYAVPVIFITAYPERLLTGQRPEPTFLITKPYDAETVKAIMSQALFFEHKARHPAKASRY